jgi:hypothetical protein
MCCGSIIFSTVVALVGTIVLQPFGMHGEDKKVNPKKNRDWRAIVEKHFPRSSIGKTGAV